MKRTDEAGEKGCEDEMARDGGVRFDQRASAPGQRGASVGKRGRLLRLNVTNVNQASAVADETPGTYQAASPASSPASSASSPASAASSPASQAGVEALIMHTVSGWVAVIHERQVYSMQIAPLGGGNFEVETTLAPAAPDDAPDELGSERPSVLETLYLRVSCGLGKGRLVRTEVEPLGPRLPQMGQMGS